MTHYLFVSTKVVEPPSWFPFCCLVSWCAGTFFWGFDVLSLVVSLVSKRTCDDMMECYIYTI